MVIMELQVKESKWLVKCFLNYLRHDKNEVNVLFDILTIFLFHSRIDYTFLKEFYIIEVLHYWIWNSCWDFGSFLYFIMLMPFRWQKVIHQAWKRLFYCIFSAFSNQNNLIMTIWWLWCKCSFFQCLHMPFKMVKVGKLLILL